jgi:hypothetical protein
MDPNDGTHHIVKHDLKGVLKCTGVEICTHYPPSLPPQIVTDTEVSLTIQLDNAFKVDSAKVFFIFSEHLIVWLMKNEATFFREFLHHPLCLCEMLT